MQLIEIYDNLKSKNIYSVKDVKRGFAYYQSLLTEKATGMYTYTGLPDSLPPEQIEMKLIIDGYAAIFDKHGLITCNGGLSGIDKYYLPTDFVYAQPALGSGNLKLHKNCVVIYNNTIDQYERIGLRELIDRDARLLADIDSTIDNIIIQTRANKLNVASNKNIAKTVDGIMTAIEDGDTRTINTDSLLDLYKTVDWYDNSNQSLTEQLNAKQNIMSSFLSEIGVKNFTEKKERLITDEVTADDQLLTINIDDMTECRKKGIDEVNKIFGTHITVERNESYDVNTYETTDGGNKDASEDVPNEQSNND